MSNYANLPAPTPEGGLSRYMQEIRKFPMLDPEEEYMLAKRWVEEQDTQAAHKMVTSHLRLAAKQTVIFPITLTRRVSVSLRQQKIFTKPLLIMNYSQINILAASLLFSRNLNMLSCVVLVKNEVGIYCWDNYTSSLH